MKLAVRAWTDHAHRMLCLQCDLPELLEQSMPPDAELVDLIEQAFLEGQINGEAQGLAYLWIEGNHPREQ